MPEELELLVAGEWTDTGDWLEVASPYDGRVVGRCPTAGAGDAADAVEAAAAAFADGPPPQHERAAVLERASDEIARRREELARGIAEEAGKPLGSARTEAARASDTLRFAAVEARTLTGQMVPLEASAAGAGKLGFTLQRPKGVVAAITPFNFPLNLVCHKVAPAIAAGCPVVLKPAGATPLSALRLARILLDCGLPLAWLHVLMGSAGEIGPAITEPETVRVITFTGSVDVGHQLERDHPHTPVLAELGNNTPVVIDDSADVARAAEKLAATGHGFAGQSCISAQRVYVHQRVADDFLDRLVVASEALAVGDPLDEATQVGPMIRPENRDRVLGLVRDAAESGAKIRTGGEVNEDGTLQPTVVDGVAPDWPVCREELFAPVLTVQRVADLDEGIALANDSRYGLQAGVFTADLDAALRAVGELAYGGVTVNESPTFRADQQPYGGLRDSGNTREGPAWAIHDYLEETVAVIDRG
jgi:acyl-CoA reductase-like NAD-dependent aldehyde dehydrogenase